jgi:hypothetical protein
MTGWKRTRSLAECTASDVFEGGITEAGFLDQPTAFVSLLLFDVRHGRL